MSEANKKVCVVIPIHKENPSSFELISFQQSYKILSSHSIYVIAPKGLNIQNYKLDDNSIKINTIFIDPLWQSTILGYNKLKLSQFFYNLFADYEYLLTYELDAFVFKDDLEFWCAKNYDYIGAPWFEGHDQPKDNLTGVGNSGFSLRKIAPIKRGLKELFYKDPSMYEVGNKKYIQAILSYPFIWLLNKLEENYSIQNANFVFEDRVICEILPKKVKEFKIAPISEAMQFSFEVKPECLYEKNNFILPMGCHAWWRYNLTFWKPFIEHFGYNLN